MKYKDLNCRLFAGMEESEIEECMRAGASVESFAKGSILFNEGDKATKVYILVSGEVSVGKYTLDGEKIEVMVFSNPGEVLGEVFLFANKGKYEYFAEALKEVKVLQVPAAYILDYSKQVSAAQEHLKQNLMMILASKAYFLNRKLEILSGKTLRQKLARYFAQNSNEKNQVELHMNREKLADFLGTTRPSLSRELSNMQEDGIISIDKNSIQILDESLLAAYI